MNKLILSMICFFILAPLSLFAQENTGTGAIEIHAIPAKSRVKIEDLGVKQKLDEEGAFMDELPAGNYDIEFKYSRYKLNGNIEVLENDTIVILGDLNANEIVWQRLEDVRKEIAARALLYSDSAISAMAKELEMQRRNAELNQIPGIYEPTDEEIGYVPPPDTLDLFEDIPEEVHYYVEIMPKFNKGEPSEEFRKYIARNLQMPENCMYEGKHTVIVQFMVGKDGYVTNLKNMTPNAPACYVKEAFRLISGSPRWTPGEKKGNPVSVLVNFPVIFRVIP
jgi:hypothetical protein